MFNKSYQLIFLMTLLIGSLLAISSNSWFTSWLGLEVNLMSMIPLMLIKINKPLTEAAIKYFLIQALASTMLIISVTMNLIFTKNLSMPSMEILLLLSLLMKAGAPPLHFWFPNISPKLMWAQCFILFTWQKVAPLLLLTSFKMYTTMGIASLSVITGALGGLNQMNMKSIMAYSSISHSGWLIMSSLINIAAWLIYFTIYCVLSLCVIFMMKKSLTNSTNSLSLWVDPPIHKYSFSLNMLSLAGLPPFLGFMAKLTIASFLVFLSEKIMLLYFVLATLLSLYFYFRMIYFFLFKNQPRKKPLNWSPSKTNNMLMTLATTTNVLAPVMFSLM